MLSDAEKMFWEQKAETLRKKHVQHLGDPKVYEKFCDVVLKRMMGEYKIKKIIDKGRIEYKWQNQ